MRFDDMIATVLERPSDRADQRLAQWRQLVDLLAQGRDGGAKGPVEQAYAFLRAHRNEVSLLTRRRIAATLAGLPIDRRLATFFGEDHPSVSAELLRGARLDEGDWIALLPALSPTGRAVLRHRRDLPEPVSRALAAFGTSDFVLGDDRDEQAGEAETVPAPAVTEGSSQIKELVERIEAFQRHREEAGNAVEPAQVDEFRWETGPEGVFLWIDGAPRGALVGQSIAAIAGGGHYGVDGQAAGAFHKRAPFRDARFEVAGEGAASGSWRISGVPYFDMSRGTFLGYRGTARRPRFDEVAPTIPGDEPAGLFGSELKPDSLRQLVHELRTPLNAIIGFAELIEGQYMGPAGGAYRGRAASIVAQAQRLLGAVDDLDTAARLESGAAEAPAAAVDLGPMLARLRLACVAAAGSDGMALSLAAAPDVPKAAIDAGAAERMLSRLFAATAGLAAPGEAIAASLRTRGDMIEVALDRPAAIASLEEPQLLHPGYSPEGDWPGAPALGLGFALRLIRKLAEAAGGTLAIHDDRFVLRLPAARAPGSAGNGEGIA